MRNRIFTVVASMALLIAAALPMLGHTDDHEDWGESGTPGFSELYKSSDTVGGFIECSTDEEFAERLDEFDARVEAGTVSQWDIGPARCRPHVIEVPQVPQYSEVIDVILTGEAENCEAYDRVREAAGEAGVVTISVGGYSVELAVESLPEIEGCV